MDYYVTPNKIRFISSLEILLTFDTDTSIICQISLIILKSLFQSCNSPTIEDSRICLPPVHSPEDLTRLNQPSMSS